MAGVVSAAVAIGNTAPPEPPRSNHPVSLENRPKHVPLSGGERRDIVAAARLFLRTAVSRHHPEQSWAISSPSLRSGQTFEQWKGGLLAVAPYPVRSARWKLAYSIRDEVGLDVWVDSADGHYPPLVFRLTFLRGRLGKGQPWLVDSWAPVTFSGSLAAALSLAAAPAAGGGSDSPRASAKSSALWVLAPLVALFLALLVPVLVSLRTRRSERRATAAFRGGSL